MSFYVLDDNNNRIEAFDKEGVLAALEEAIANGSLESLVADTGFIKKLKCCVTGSTSQVAFVTTAKYNELDAAGTLERNTAYFITDDTTLDNVDTSLADLTAKVNGIIEGTIIVPVADRLNSVVIYEGDKVAKGSTVSGQLEDGYRYIVGVTDALGIAQWIATGIAQRGALYAEFVHSAESETLNKKYIKLSNGDSVINYDDCVSVSVSSTGAVISTASLYINKIVRLEKVF